MALGTPPDADRVPHSAAQPRVRPSVRTVFHWLRACGGAVWRFVRRILLARCWRSLTHSAETPRPIPWRALLRLAFPLWLLTRLLALVVTYFSQTMLRPTVIQSPRHGPISLANMLYDWRLWDGGFYGQILQHGYTPDRPINAAFWPLFPLLAKPFEVALGTARWEVALLIVSNLATLAAFVLVGALAMQAAQEDETLGAARRAMTLLAAAPLAFFLIGAYSDSLFLALACAALFTARRGQWRAAVLWAFLAALARPVGVVLVALLVWEYGRQSGLAPMATTVIVVWRRWRVGGLWKAHGVWRLLAGRAAGLSVVALAAPLGMGVFSLVCWRAYRDPLAWLHAQEQVMSHTLMWPWSAVALAWREFAALPPASFAQARVLVDYGPLVFVALFTVATAILPRIRIPFAETLLLVGLVLVCVVAPVEGTQFPEAFVSAGRYLLPAIPVYLGLARLVRRYPWLETALVGGGFALQALLMAFVLTGGWLV